MSSCTAGKLFYHLRLDVAKEINRIINDPIMLSWMHIMRHKCASNSPNTYKHGRTTTQYPNTKFIVTFTVIRFLITHTCLWSHTALTLQDSQTLTQCKVILSVHISEFTKLVYFYILILWYFDPAVVCGFQKFGILSLFMLFADCFF